MAEDIHENRQEENSELYEHHRIVVDPGQQALRIDKFLMGRIENATRNKIQLAIKAGNVLVNDAAIKPNYKVKSGDVIRVVLSYPPREIEVVPEDIPLNIVYEDQDLLIVNKEAGMVVHPAYANYNGTLVNALAYYLQKEDENQQEAGPFLVHRIDKDTSGLMVAAKNELAQNRLAKVFFYHNIERKYQALVWGDVQAESATIEGHVGRSPKDRRVMQVFPDGSYGKEAVTHYKVLKRFGYVTLVECKLETGRTHQIRAHMRYIGHPLFNDKRYGGDQILKGTPFTKYKQFVKNCFNIIPRQALHAKSLGFSHPSSGELLHFDSELPEDMQQVLKKWETYTSNRLISDT